MIEFTITEIVLLAWAVIATGFALRYKAERRMVSHMMQHIVENEEAYQQIRRGWEIARGFVKN